MASAPAEQIGAYTVRERIGEGGEGTVYRAIRQELGHPRIRPGEVVALKRLASHGFGRQGQNDFRRQCEMLQSLDHPAIVRYLDSFLWREGEWDESCCLVTEFLDGENLHVMLARRPDRRLCWQEALPIFSQCLDALVAVSQSGFVHRDIKPSNIFILRDGTMRLIDFGIARSDGGTHVSTAGLRGTVDYMAPDLVRMHEEAFRGDTRSDIYSFGVCLYQALTGRLPFRPIQPPDMTGFFRRWNSAVSDPTYDGTVFQETEGLAEFLRRCLAQARGVRFPSFQAVAEALAGIRDALPDTSAGPPEADVPASEVRTERIGGYLIQSKIASGGEGIVYRAISEDTSPPRVRPGAVVAIKRLWARGESLEGQLAFQRQCKILETLEHPNIVRYLDGFVWRPGESDESCCLVTEFLDGEDLHTRLKQHPGGLPWEEVQSIFTQCFAALIWAAENRVIHRDLKPSNIFILRDGTVRLIDFGIARQAGPGITTVSTAGPKGTVDYMAPDYVRLRDGAFQGDEQSDLFSLGVCLFEAMTGQRPFTQIQPQEMLAFYHRWSGIEPVPEPPYREQKAFRVLNHMVTFLRGCLAQDRKDRVASFQDAAKQFQAIARRRIRHRGGDSYVLMEYIDRGGFGEVFRALNERTSEQVAVKHLRALRGAKRFLQEAKLLKEAGAKLNQHMVRFVDLIDGQARDAPDYYLLLEFLEGMPEATLHRRIRSSPGGLDPIETARLFVAYLGALDYLHEHREAKGGIIHRDIKPQNLYAPPGDPDRAKVFDLGVAADLNQTRTLGARPGTYEYMAPEFIRGSFRGSPRSDLFSLGLCLHEALTGRPLLPRLPLDPDQAAQAFIARCRDASAFRIKEEFEVYRTNPRLRRVVEQAIAFDPRRRYPTAAAMRAELKAFIEYPSGAPPETIGGGKTRGPAQDIEIIETQPLVPGELYQERTWYIHLAAGVLTLLVLAGAGAGFFFYRYAHFELDWDEQLEPPIECSLTGGSTVQHIGSPGRSWRRVGRYTVSFVRADHTPLEYDVEFAPFDIKGRRVNPGPSWNPTEALAWLLAFQPAEPQPPPDGMSESAFEWPEHRTRYRAASALYSLRTRGWSPSVIEELLALLEGSATASWQADFIEAVDILSAARVSGMLSQIDHWSTDSIPALRERIEIGPSFLWKERDQFPHFARAADTLSQGLTRWAEQRLSSETSTHTARTVAEAILDWVSTEDVAYPWRQELNRTVDGWAAVSLGAHVPVQPWQDTPVPAERMEQAVASLPEALWRVPDSGFPSFHDARQRMANALGAQLRELLNDPVIPEARGSRLARVRDAIDHEASFLVLGQEREALMRRYREEMGRVLVRFQNPTRSIARVTVPGTGIPPLDVSPGQQSVPMSLDAGERIFTVQYGSEPPMGRTLRGEGGQGYTVPLMSGLIRISVERPAQGPPVSVVLRFSDGSSRTLDLVQDWGLETWADSGQIRVEFSRPDYSSISLEVSIPSDPGSDPIRISGPRVAEWEPSEALGWLLSFNPHDPSDPPPALAESGFQWPPHKNAFLCARRLSDLNRGWDRDIAEQGLAFLAVPEPDMPAPMVEPMRRGFDRLTRNEMNRLRQSFSASRLDDLPEAIRSVDGRLPASAWSAGEVYPQILAGRAELSVALTGRIEAALNDPVMEERVTRLQRVQNILAEDGTARMIVNHASLQDAFRLHESMRVVIPSFSTREPPRVDASLVVGSTGARMAVQKEGPVPLPPGRYEARFDRPDYAPQVQRFEISGARPEAVVTELGTWEPGDALAALLALEEGREDADPLERWSLVETASHVNDSDHRARWRRQHEQTAQVLADRLDTQVTHWGAYVAERRRLLYQLRDPLTNPQPSNAFIQPPEWQEIPESYLAGGDEDTRRAYERLGAWATKAPGRELASALADLARRHGEGCGCGCRFEAELVTFSARRPLRGAAPEPPGNAPPEWMAWQGHRFFAAGDSTYRDAVSALRSAFAAGWPLDASDRRVMLAAAAWQLNLWKSVVLQAPHQHQDRRERAREALAGVLAVTGVLERGEAEELAAWCRRSHGRSHWDGVLPFLVCAVRRFAPEEHPLRVALDRGQSPCAPDRLSEAALSGIDPLR